MRGFVLKEINVDLDGVLFDFDKYYEECFGPVVDDATLWKNINKHGSFFRNIKPFEHAHSLWNRVRMLDPNAKILTATGWKYDDVTKQKLEACYEHFGIVPEDIITVKAGKDKAQYANPKAILVDDMMKNIDAWEAAGGIGIWHTNIDDTIHQLEEMFRN